MFEPRLHHDHHHHHRRSHTGLAHFAVLRLSAQHTTTHDGWVKNLLEPVMDYGIFMVIKSVKRKKKRKKNFLMRIVMMRMFAAVDMGFWRTHKTNRRTSEQIGRRNLHGDSNGGIWTDRFYWSSTPIFVFLFLLILWISNCICEWTRAMLCVRCVSDTVKWMIANVTSPIW